MCSGAGEGRRRSGCRRPADGHDRHEDGGKGVLMPRTHSHLYSAYRRYTHTHSAASGINLFVSVSAAHDPGA